MSKAPKSNPKRDRDFEGQHEDESVILVFNQHPVIMRWPLIFGMLAILVGILPAIAFPLSNVPFMIFGVVVLVVIIYWFYHWANWHYSVYVITNQRLIDITQRGLFNRKVNEVGWDKVQSINYHIKGLQATLLKYGDINVQTYTGEWVLESIHHPAEIHSRLMEASHSVNSWTPPEN